MSLVWEVSLSKSFRDVRVSATMAQWWVLLKNRGRGLGRGSKGTCGDPQPLTLTSKPLANCAGGGGGVEKPLYLGGAVGG